MQDKSADNDKTVSDKESPSKVSSNSKMTVNIQLKGNKKNNTSVAQKLMSL